MGFGPSLIPPFDTAGQDCRRGLFGRKGHSGMAHEVAKLLLEHAGTFLERTEAIKAALNLGMPLEEIEAYLDWLDLLRADEDSQGPRGADERL